MKRVINLKTNRHWDLKIKNRKGFIEIKELHKEAIFEEAPYILIPPEEINNVIKALKILGGKYWEENKK